MMAAVVTFGVGCMLPALPATAAQTPASHCGAGTVTTYVPPAGDGFPFGVVANAGGTWFAHGSTIDRIQGGRIVQYPIPGVTDAGAGWLTDDHHGLIWFTERGTGRLGSIDGAGHIRQYTIPDGTVGVPIPQAIVLIGGGVWFTDALNNRIGRLDLGSGGFDFFTVPTGGPGGMTLGHDGDLYFTERDFDKIGRLDPRTGLFTEWQLTVGASPNRFAVDPRGNVWFTELGTNGLGWIDGRGHVHQIALAGGAVGITFANHHLYTAMYTAGGLDELTPSGQVVKTWSLPGAVGVLQVAVRGPNAWVTDGFGEHVYRVDTACPGDARRQS